LTFIDDHSDKPLFPRGPALTLRVLILMGICLGLMVREARYEPMEGLRSALSTVVQPILWTASIPGQIGGIGEAIESRINLTRDNELLREKQIAIDVRLERMEALEEENRRLRKLLETAVAHTYPYAAVNVMSVSQSPYRDQFMLDKGTQDGVYRGQPVIDDEGVVGQVVEVHPFSALALLITDPAHGMPVENNRTGLQTIAQGLGDGERLRLPFLPGNADIAIGDLLVSSPLGGRFPSGYPVGRVIDVRQRPGETFKEAIAETSADLDARRHLLLLWVNPPADDEAAADAPTADDPPGEAGVNDATPPQSNGTDADPAAPPAERPD